MTTHYCVVLVRTGEVVYMGTSVSDAAEHLEEGTTYGRHSDQATAHKIADQHARKMREVVRQ